MTTHTIYNENCFDTIERFKTDGTKVNVILTSPPYNTARYVKTERAMEILNNRYDIHFDNMSDEDYHNWTRDLFTEFEKVLAPNGVILYNISYGSENPNAMWEAVEAIRETDFMIADTIIWKKSSALPNNTSSNKLTRIVEFVFVVCRKSEFGTFQANKGLKSISEKTGQKYYENVFNFIEAPNNDGPCKLNKATYSSQLVLDLLNIYARENDIIYDPFMGTGTTVIGCHRYADGHNNLVCYGSELSAAQIEFSENRIREYIAAHPVEATLF
jgi:site-specific DNA-methyltransferase (adenine-specific)/modification methylase